MNLIIRSPRRSDLKVFHRFINKLSQEKTFIMRQGEKISMKEERAWLNRVLESIRKGESVCLLTEIGGELAGSTQITRNKHARSHIGSFAISVAKKFRGMGIGKKLMAEIHALAKKKFTGLKIFELSVFADNHLAQKMYKKFGYKECGRMPKGVMHDKKYVDEIFMYKKVT